jgi:hypothetical protein
MPFANDKSFSLFQFREFDFSTNSINQYTLCCKSGAGSMKYAFAGAVAMSILVSSTPPSLAQQINCGRMAESRKAPGCFLHVVGKDFQIGGVIHAYGNCPATTSYGYPIKVIPKAKPSPVGDGFCKLPGARFEYNPITKATR